MTSPPDRWILPDLDAATALVRQRNRQGIRCILAINREYAGTPADAEAGLRENLDCLRGIAAGGTPASLSVKSTALGSIFDADASRKKLLAICRSAADHRIPLELDMEGKGTVDFTIGLAIACAKVHPRITLALQAYLHRTLADLDTVTRQGIGVRLVKGAYLGDTDDFAGIQGLMKSGTERLISLGRPFSFGTHDPDLIAWLRERLGSRKDLAEFGFLKGLSDETKTGLASEGWMVSEYVPFGPGGEAYRQRRERYLALLDRLGRSPAP